MRRVDKPRPFEKIGRRIELIRQASGYSTKTKFADAIGLSPQGYNGYANGTERIGVDAAIRVCKRFGASLDFIYRGLEFGVVGTVIEKIREIRAIEEPEDNKDE